MDHQLSVVVQVDTDARYVHLVVTGCLTELNHCGLPPLVRRARTLVPGGTVNVDLTAAHHVEPAAVQLLQCAVDHDHAREPGATVRVLTHPEPFWSPAEPALLPPLPPLPPVHPAARSRAPRHRDGVAA